MDLGRDKVTKIFWTYAIPSILLMIIQSTAGFIDSIFVGRYVGTEGLSSISVVFPILGVLIALGMMVVIGGTTIAGIEKGASNFERSNNLFNVTTSLLVIIGLVSGLVIYLFVPQLLEILAIHGKTLSYAVDYGRTLGVFAVFFLISFSFSFFLKLDGKPLLMLVTMITGTVSNIVLDYWFIAHLGLGVKGAALATGLSQVIPVVLMFLVILKRSSWSFRLPNFKFKDVHAIFYNGISEFLTNIASSITGLILNFFIMREVGTIGLAAFSVAIHISGIVSSVSYAFGEANQSAISYNFGAQNYSRVKKLFKMTHHVCMLSGVILTVLIYVNRGALASIFITEVETLNLATEILGIISLSYVFIGTNVSIATYFTAINDPFDSAMISFYRSLVAPLLGLYVLTYFFGSSGIWLMLVFSELTSLILATYIYKKRPFGQSKNYSIGTSKQVAT